MKLLLEAHHDLIYKAFALAGRNLHHYLPRALPWAGISLAFQAVFMDHLWGLSL